MRVYHFMRYKWWFLGSLTAVTIFAVMAIFVVGLDFGIDFKGGVRIQFSLESEASVDDIRGLVRTQGSWSRSCSPWRLWAGWSQGPPS